MDGGRESSHPRRPGRDRRRRAPVARLSGLSRLLRILCLPVLQLAACGTHSSDATLGEELQGNWTYQSTVADQGFTRRENVAMEVDQTSIKYNYNILWECDPAGSCPGKPPDPKGGYFEGIFRDLGDSLALQDGTDTLAFRDITDSSFTFIVNGLSFPMRRN